MIPTTISNLVVSNTFVLAAGATLSGLSSLAVSTLVAVTATVTQLFATIIGSATTPVASLYATAGYFSSVLPSTSTADIGGTSNYFRSGYVNTLYTGAVGSASVPATSVWTSFIGGSSNYVGTAYITTVLASYIGSVSAFISAVYATVVYSPSLVVGFSTDPTTALVKVDTTGITLYANSGSPTSLRPFSDQAMIIGSVSQRVQSIYVASVSCTNVLADSITSLAFKVNGSLTCAASASIGTILSYIPNVYANFVSVTCPVIATYSSLPTLSYNMVGYSTSVDFNQNVTSAPYPRQASLSLFPGVWLLNLQVYVGFTLPQTVNAYISTTSGGSVGAGSACSSITAQYNFSNISWVATVVTTTTWYGSVYMSTSGNIATARFQATRIA